MAELAASHTDLGQYLIDAGGGEQTIDFGDSAAVLALNAALIKHFYHVKFWQMPPSYLCPPIPGRADYIHYLADLIAEGNNRELPKGKRYRVLDIGTGASCIYPIIGNAEYGWQFTASDIDTTALKVAGFTVQSNPRLKNAITLAKQPRTNRYFKQVLKPHVKTVATMCNPPFYASEEEAREANERKSKNLGISSERNFGGQSHELWCDGGEFKFIYGMMQESQQYHENVCWFTSLLSNNKHIDALCEKAEQVGAAQFRTVDMAQGQKVSRFVAWSFMTEEEQSEWLANLA